MSNRTWACVPCRKSYRRSQSVDVVVCAECHQPCESVPWKLRVPSPRRNKEWEAFWSAYRAEQALLEAHRRSELRETSKLPLLNVVLDPLGRKADEVAPPPPGRE